MIENSPSNGFHGTNNVVLCADPRFALGAWVAIWSAYKNSGRDLSFYLLTTGADSAPMRKMQSLAKRAGILLSIVPVDTQLIEHLPTSARLSFYTYIRLLAPGVLPHLDRFLYLDADILVRSSLLPLFADPPDGKLASGARDYFYSDIQHGLKQTYERLGLDPAAPYLNAGVLMINARSWRQEDITTQALNYLQQYRSTIKHPDQDALNAVLSGKLAEVDISWNVQIGAIRFFDRTGWPEDRAVLKGRKVEILSEAKIAHFIGPSKPWRDGLRVPYVKEYRKIVVASEWIPKWWAGPWAFCWFLSALRQAFRRRFRNRGQPIVPSSFDLKGRRSKNSSQNLDLMP
jgi:lipopolysaccharide biosynthesis glycosyltransferase